MRESLERLCMPNSGVCVGIDPDISKMPLHLQAKAHTDPVFAFIEDIVSITSSIASAYKIQKAFFDLMGDGKEMLKDTISCIRKHSDAPVIIDAKIGDIGNTMKAYLKTMFDYLDADAVTVNPYMGSDVFELAEKYNDRAFVTLFRTSNQGSRIVQDQLMKDSTPLWDYLLRTALRDWNGSNNIIPVVSGDVGREPRIMAGDDTPILYAGFGAQGADLNPVNYLFNSRKSGVIINSSRGILYPYKTDDPGWREKVYEATSDLACRIKEVRNWA